jgi:hypothetical protein
MKRPELALSATQGHSEKAIIQDKELHQNLFMLVLGIFSLQDYEK